MSDSRSALRTLVHAGFAVAVRGAGALASLLVTLLVARTLGAAEAGLFFLCFTLLQVLATPGRLGLDSTVLRFAGAAIAGDNWAAARQVLFTACRWTLLCSVAIALLLLPLADWLANRVFDKPEVAGPLRFTLLAVPMLALLPVIAAALKAAGRPMWGLGVQSILAPAATAALLLPLLLVTGNAADATLAMVGGHLVALLLAVAIWQALPRHGDAAGTPANHLLIASARPMLAVSLMSLLATWSAQLVAAALVPAHELAWLSVAQRTAAVLALPHLAITATLAAQAAACHARGDQAGLAALVSRATLTASLLAGLPALVLVLAAGPVMGLFGDDFRAGGALLVILVIGQVVNVMTGPVVMLLTVSGHERDIRNLTFFSGLLAVLLAVFFTLWWGVTGAAVATTIAVAAQNIALLFCVRQRLGFWTLSARAFSARSHRGNDA